MTMHTMLNLTTDYVDSSDSAGDHGFSVDERVLTSPTQAQRQLRLSVYRVGGGV